MPLQVYPTFSSPPGNGQNCFPMLYYAIQNPYQHHQHPHYDPSTASFLAMPSLLPEQQPLYYTIDQHGNYVLLTPPQSSSSRPLSSDQSDISSGGEQCHQVLPTTYSYSMESSLDSSQPSDPTPSFYDPRNLLNLSLGGFGRKVGAGKTRVSSAYKTMLCNMFSTNGSCSYGTGCQYAHGAEEIRPAIPHPKYKTQLCNKFSTSRGCQYGEKCHFRHPDDLEAELNEMKKKEKNKKAN
uniref:C3H1-type domain-containing protein n=1 Tax=Panagrolaimus sp. ES5 TaxID=591445 RepID=A0AC34FS89_9BILA